MRISLPLLAIAATGCLVNPTAPSSDPPPSTDSTTRYSPYFYTWGWSSTGYAFDSLVGMQHLGGPSDVTLAFTTSNGGCNVTTDVHDNLADVRAFTAAGGRVRASFGGETGTYVESTCFDAPDLATELAGFVDDTGITDLDFDIEQGAATSNPTINSTRAAALKSLQDSRQVHVSFTLPVGPDGLDDLGLAVVSSALSGGVALSYVNAMTMDYGPGADLATTPEQSITATAAQLQTLIPDLSVDAAYQMLGVTPMIGDNDDPETFSIADADALAAYAERMQLGLISFWAIQRDEACGASVDLDTCNGVGTSTFQFSKIFAGLAN